MEECDRCEGGVRKRLTMLPKEVVSAWSHNYVAVKSWLDNHPDWYAEYYELRPVLQLIESGFPRNREEREEIFRRELAINNCFKEAKVRLDLVEFVFKEEDCYYCGGTGGIGDPGLTGAPWREYCGDCGNHINRDEPLSCIDVACDNLLCGLCCMKKEQRGEIPILCYDCWDRYQIHRIRDHSINDSDD